MINENNLGISYLASYLVQGNQLERCNTSMNLGVKNTELIIRTDGRDSDISNIVKAYKENLIFHVPTINPDLSNINIVNDLVKKLKDNKIKLITINASNLSLDLFEWSTLEEQKMYFLNIVTSIATIASNKIEVAIENLKYDDLNGMFGSSISHITDILVYVRRLLIRDFGFTEEESIKYVGLSLNVDNINYKKENINNWFEVFSDDIKCIKIHNIEYFDDIKNKIDKNVLVFLQSFSDLEEVINEYNNLKNKLFYNDFEMVNENKNVVNKSNNSNELTNLIIFIMIVLTIVIVIMMFFVKLK